MAWNGSGNFQRTNGSFSGTSVWEDDANAGFDIVDSRHDNHDQDIAQGINNCLTKDGQNSPTADLSMNTFKHTNVGDGTARNHYATIGQLQDQAVQALSSVGGTADAITATMIPAISAYITGAQYTFKAVSSNTGATTLKIGTGSVLAVQWLGAALTAGQIAANAWHTVVYDGSLFQLLNPAMSGSARTLPVSVAQLQDGSVIWCGTSGGSANAQTLTPSPAISAYAAGQVFRFSAGFTSTGALTLQVSGIAGPKTCLMKGSFAPFSNLAFLVAGATYEAVYDGTNFLISDLMDLANYSNDAGAARIKLYKSRAATFGGNTIVQNGDGLGQIDFYGANGTGFTRGAYIQAVVDGTPGASNDMPTAIAFGTTPDGSGAPTEKTRVTSAGNLLVNQISTSSFVDGTVSITSLTGTTAATLRQTNGSASFVATAWNSDTIGNNSLLQFLTEATPTGRGSITYNRGSGVVAYNTTSDERLKENIIDAPSALPLIASVKIRSYDWKETGNHVAYGAIAQELVTVAPQAVTPGDTAAEIQQPWGVDFSQLVPPTLRAVQELIKMVEALEARVEALEA